MNKIYKYLKYTYTVVSVKYIKNLICLKLENSVCDGNDPRFNCLIRCLLSDSSRFMSSLVCFILTFFTLIIYLVKM